MASLHHPVRDLDQLIGRSQLKSLKDGRPGVPTDLALLQCEGKQLLGRQMPWAWRRNNGLHVACGSPSCWRSEFKMWPSCDEQWGSSGSLRQTVSAGFYQEHQDHDGRWRCLTWSPSSATAGTKVRRESLANVAGNEHRWVDHGYLIEDCKRHAQGCLLVA
jgi:hypothetical protein